MPAGGYVKENGISVCDECHIKVEKFWEWFTSKKPFNERGPCPVTKEFSPRALFRLIDSSGIKALEALEASLRLDNEPE